MKRFGLLILAAGEASRMGSPKQLLDIGGIPLVRHVAANGLASHCNPVVAVLGANSSQIRAVLPETVLSVENPRWQEGMGTSIQAGLRALQDYDLDGAILTLADQPFISADILNRLIEIHEQTGQPIVAARYAGTVGVPVLFTHEYFQHLNALDPGQGCKGVILKNRHLAATFSCPEAEADIDTPDDYRRILLQLAAG